MIVTLYHIDLFNQLLYSYQHQRGSGFHSVLSGFNNAPHKMVCKEAAQKGVPAKLVEWIRSTQGRRVIASQRTVEVEIMGWVEKGCP